jgi:hypothetical protein
MLFDPVKQQLDLPSRLVEGGDLGGGALQIIGQQSDSLPVGALDCHRLLQSRPDAGALTRKRPSPLWASASAEDVKAPSDKIAPLAAQ